MSECAMRGDGDYEPSLAETLLLVAMALSLGTFTISSIWSVRQFLGMKPAPMPTLAVAMSAVRTD